MSRIPDNKRKRSDAKSPAQNLSEAERTLYDLIRSKEDMGIWTGDMKRETRLQDNLINKYLKSLQTKKLIKEVVNIKSRGKKYFMAVEFEPSKELTGGDWYVDGNYDMDFIKGLKNVCKQTVQRQKIATVESVSEFISNSSILKMKCTTQQISEIMQALVLDNEIMEVKSTGLGDYATYRIGTLCYRIVSKTVVPKIGAMASIPCGACPHINECTPEGIISPTTCVYYRKWLDI